MCGKPNLKELKAKVFDLCDRLGFWNVRPVPVAKQLGTAHQNVSRWKQKYIKKFGIPDIERFGKELNVNSQVVLQELIKLSKDSDKKIRISAIKTFFDSQESFTHFLESFGYKDKVAEKLDVMTGATFNLIEKSVEEIKNEKSNNKPNATDNKPEAEGIFKDSG